MLYVSLLRDRRVFLLWFGQLLSRFGDGIHDVALIWVALELSGGNYAIVGTLIFLRFLPYVVFGPIGGYFSDRADRLKVTVATDIARFAIVVLLALVLKAELHQILALGAAVFLLTLCRTFFQPSIQGLLPTLVDGDEIVSANALMFSSAEVAGIIAPTLAGIAIATFPIEVIFFFDAMTYAISAVCLALLARNYDSLPPVQADLSTSVPRRIIGDFSETGKQLLRSPILGISLVSSVLAIFFAAGFLRLLVPALSKDVLDGGAQLLGYLLSSMSVGTLFGALLVGRVRQQLLRNMLIAWLFYGLLMASFAFVHNTALVLAVAFFLGSFGAVADVLFGSIVQLFAPANQIGKVFSVFSTIANSFEALSGLLVGVLLGFLSIQQVILAYAVFASFISAAVLVREVSKGTAHVPRVPEGPGGQG